MFLHDVAIRTGLGGIRKVGAALGVIKSISSHADGAAKKKAGDNHKGVYTKGNNTNFFTSRHRSGFSRQREASLRSNF